MTDALAYDLRSRPQPPGEILAILARRSWIVLTAAVVGAFASLGFAAAVTGGGTTATGRVGLTPASEWPLYVADLGRFLRAVEDPELQARAVGDAAETAETELTAELDESNYHVDVVLVGVGSEEAVAAFLDAVMASALEVATDAEVAASLDEIDELEAEFDRLSEQLATAESAIAESDEELLEIAVALDENWSASLDADRRIASDARSPLVAERSRLLLQLGDVERQLASIRREALGGPHLEVLRSARVDPDGPSWPVAAAAAIGAALLATALVIWWEREHGRIGGRWQIEQLLGLPTIDGLDRDASPPARVADALAVALGRDDGSESTRVVGLVGVGPASSEASPELVRALVDDFPGLFADSAAPRPDHRTEPGNSIALLGVEDEDSSAAALGSAGRVALVVVAGSDRMGHLRARFDECVRLGRPPVLAVLLR